ncbi:hypothetical protein IK146_01320 [Candidatus Saccharibacteria bacterium]|nr:hypothetical protein [Candidatus Saccharibacteria bacterium]
MDNIGKIILVVATTIVGFLLYDNLERRRKKDFLETHEMSREERCAREREDRDNHWALIARLIIWLTCAIFAFLGDTLGVILTVLFTIEALWRIYYEAFGAVKSRVGSLVFLAIPFGGVAAAYCTKPTGIIGGILIGILAVVLVQICHMIGKIYREHDREE